MNTLITKSQINSVCELVQVSMAATIEKVLVGETFRVLEAMGHRVELKEKIAQTLLTEEDLKEILKSFSFMDKETLEKKILNQGKRFQDLLTIELEVAVRRTFRKLIEQ